MVKIKLSSCVYNITYSVVSLVLVLFLVLPVACSNSGKEAKEAKEENQKVQETSTTTQLLSQKNKRLKVTTYETQGTAVKTLTFDGTDLWIGTTTRGVLKFDTTSKDSIAQYNNTNALISNGAYSITKGPDGSIWVGTYGGGMSRLKNGKWSNFNIQHGLCDAFVYDIHFDKNGVMWVATWSGINKIEGDIQNRASWKKITRENTNMGLSDDWVYAIEIAADGTLWFGTEVGINRFNGKEEWNNWQHKDGLGANIDLLKAENQRQSVQLSGSHHQNRGNIGGKQAREIKNFNPNHITSLILDKQGKVWIGTWGGGLSRFDGEKFTNFSVKDGLLSNYVLVLVEGPNGDIWAGTDMGIIRFDGQKFTKYTEEDGLLTNFTFALSFDEKGRLWAGGQGGVTRIDEILEG